MSSILDLGFIFFCVLILGCILSRKYLRIFFISVTVIYYLIASGVIANLLLKPLPFYSTNISQCSDTKGIILLGGGISKTADSLEPSLSAYDRIMKTSEVYHKYHLPIIISGGITNGVTQSEASVYARSLEQLGVNKSDITLEEKSINTYQNAKFVKLIIGDNKNKYCLITDSVHLVRSKMYFENFNVYIVGLASSEISPDMKLMPKAYNIYVTQRILNEYFGIVKAYLQTGF